MTEKLITENLTGLNLQLPPEKGMALWPPKMMASTLVTSRTRPQNLLDAKMSGLVRTRPVAPNKQLHQAVDAD
ncbi:hypothetical protein [Methylophaga sp.]|jgi:hypothetical protein|uniref:hypothetical protein n=1 Tax=Methylophaga sp. TaxID=2024840 RepID=UPI0014006554|nr:hypothetical protein [Methylophaga sp.]MTI63061.1 hypothetical protein [Methylophaga sp.]